MVRIQTDGDMDHTIISTCEDSVITYWRIEGTEERGREGEKGREREREKVSESSGMPAFLPQSSLVSTLLEEHRSTGAPSKHVKSLP